MTVHEIARLAGVSIGTVDRVLHKRGRVSAETMAKVESIIAQYHFVPNPIARRLKRSRSYRFYALVPQSEQDAGFWGQIIAGIQRAAAEIRHLGVETEIVEFDRYDPAAFDRIADSVSESRPDGLIFAPVAPKWTRPFMERIHAEKIPFIFVDTDMPDSSPLSVIGQDPFGGGYLAGRLLHLFIGQDASPVAVLNTHGEDYHIIRRRDGFLSYAQEHGFPVMVQEYSADAGLEFSVREITQFLQEHPGLAGLFITNCMAHRVAEAAALLHKDSRQSPRKWPLVGYDLIPANRQLLREGRIDAIIGQRPEEQGREALFTLYQSVVLGQPVEPRQEIPLDVYIRENIPQF